MDQSALHEFESPSSPLYGFRPYDVPAAAPHGSTMVNDQASDPDTTAQANTTERRNVRNVEERSTANGVDISENDTQPLQARVPFALEENSPPYRPLMPQQHPDLPGRIPVPGATVERSHGPRATPAAQQLGGQRSHPSQAYTALAMLAQMALAGDQVARGFFRAQKSATDHGSPEFGSLPAANAQVASLNNFPSRKRFVNKERARLGKPALQYPPLTSAQRTLQAGYDQRRAERLASEHKRHGMGASQ